jgi:hypothetical protein
MNKMKIKDINAFISNGSEIALENVKNRNTTYCYTQGGNVSFEIIRMAGNG